MVDVPQRGAFRDLDVLSNSQRGQLPRNSQF